MPPELSKPISRAYIVICVTILWLTTLVSISSMLFFDKTQIVNIDRTLSRDKESASTISLQPKQEDLIFYDKKAFIRHFSNEFSVDELNLAYNRTTADDKQIIRVTKRTLPDPSARSFSGSFEVKPIQISQ